MGTKFLSDIPTAGKPDKINRAGGEAYSRTLEERVLCYLMCGTCENTYYAGKEQLTDEMTAEFKQMATKDPRLFSRMCVYARNEGFMRTVPILGWCVLSSVSPEFAKECALLILRTPTDLKQAVIFCRKKQARGGLGRSLKEIFANRLLNISEYHLLKYGGHSRGQGINLADIVKLVHPKAGNDVQHAKIKHLLRIKYDRTLLPQVASVRALRLVSENKELSKEDKESKAASLIKEFKLPWEAATSFGINVWRAVQYQMPVFALIRNLRNLLEKDVLDIERFAKSVTPESIRKAKILPFQVMTALDIAEKNSAPERVILALRGALQASADNLEIPFEKVVVAVDDSGSMNGRPFEVASILGATVGATKGAQILMVGDGVGNTFTIRKGASVIETIKKMKDCYRGGSTELSAAVNWLIEKNYSCDLFVLVTDNETWVETASGRGSRPQGVWEEYRRRINPKAKAVHVAVQGYGDFIAPHSDKSVIVVSGWNDAALKAAFTLLESDAQVAMLKKGLPETVNQET